MKVKNSAKGKVLMRALYGIEAVTVFICSVFVAALSGSPKPLVELRVPRKFGWSQAFSDLHVTISRELRRQLSRGSVSAVKELEEVESSARKLHELTRTAQLKEETDNLACAVSHSVEVVMSDSTSQNIGHEDNLKLAGNTSREHEGTQQAEMKVKEDTRNRGLEDNLKLTDDTGRECEVIMSEITTQEGTQEAEMTLKEDTKTISHENELTMLKSIGEHNNLNKTNGIRDENSTMVPERTSSPEGSEQLLDCISTMSKSAKELRLGLDSLSKRVGDFFQIVLTGRDALLCNLRMSDAASKIDEVRS
jgi:hypothetical protein